MKTKIKQIFKDLSYEEIILLQEILILMEDNNYLVSTDNCEVFDSLYEKNHEFMRIKIILKYFFLTNTKN
jgi:hypothetical protein